MENTKPAPVTVGPQEGPTVSVVGDNYRILMSGRQTGGAYAAIEMLIPPGGGPGPHSHGGFQESFYVVDGEIEVKSEGSTYIAQKGAFVNIPLGGVVHCFKNKSEQMAHLLCVVVPSGLEEFFMEIGVPVTPGTFLPEPVMTPDLQKKLFASAEKHGQKLFPPDYLG